MTETVVRLKPTEEWRKGLTRETLIAELDEKLRMPGVTNIWTQPIKNRIDMLSTGIRSQSGRQGIWQRFEDAGANLAANRGDVTQHSGRE